MIRIVNLNMAASETGGCLRIQSALQLLSAGQALDFELVHQAELRAQPRNWDGVHGVVLGPQGTPFSAYDDGFLPWLRSWVLSCPVPILGVCGGMQALALAFGGRLATAYGGAIDGTTYGNLRKVVGPLPLQFEFAALPGWLTADARKALLDCRQDGWYGWESHVEQVADLPADFVALAHSEPTPVEAFAHRTRAILASQFHPELGWDDRLPQPLPEVLVGAELAECRAGRAWLQAWLALLQGTGEK